MPGHFKQKILNALGVNQHAGSPQDQSLPPGVAKHQPSRERVQVQIQDDERPLTSGPNHGTYPRLTRLADGSLLSSVTQFPDGQNALRIARSTDGGRTFHEYAEVTRATGEIDNLFLLEVIPGTVLAAFRNHDRGPEGLTHFRITVCRSTDGGRTWQYASQAAEKSPPWGIWEPFMRIGREGEVQLTYSHEYAHNNQCTMLVVSHDLGSSWSEPVCLYGREEPLRDGMNGIATTFDNGREVLIMVFETTRYGPFSIEALVSYDDGATWQDRQEVFRPRPGHNAGAPQISAFADGSLVVVFMTDDDSEQVDWVQHASIKAIFAGPPQNGRISWSEAYLVSPESSVWPGVSALDQHTALVTYDRGGPLVKTILRGI
ncbi:Exo-alpha-L-1,5-arabinanase [Penicillium ucsense]|uniref:Exo-alpha-L-1,5-arabinanase n=1 Tax=Penicillium ucsense TaxID=2839758 RepID=A0A8J8W8K4_9EURO|nr:Exo-alpha-L-1,5-arabinanase [Penicillium ucsense]KAF7738527.1 Exo-alpha-L-1,5-arabinanase [Penicillium ucsense]